MYKSHSSGCWQSYRRHFPLIVAFIGGMFFAFNIILLYERYNHKPGNDIKDILNVIPPINQQIPLPPPPTIQQPQSAPNNNEMKPPTFTDNAPRNDFEQQLADVERVQNQLQIDSGGHDRVTDPNDYHQVYKGMHCCIVE
jgi:hypothetical protein